MKRSSQKLLIDDEIGIHIFSNKIFLRIIKSDFCLRFNKSVRALDVSNMQPSSISRLRFSVLTLLIFSRYLAFLKTILGKEQPVGISKPK